jgi:hypothetical protein
MNGPRRTELAEQPAVISLPHLGIQTTGGSGFEMTPMSGQAAVARGPVSAGPLCAHTAVRVDGTLPSTYPGERDLHTAGLAELRTDDGVVTVEQGSPSLVTEVGRTRRRPDNIGGHHRRK